jgi:outer membrane protein assembly factor BamB
MRYIAIGALGLVLATGLLWNQSLAQTPPIGWSQWGQDSQHQGFVANVAQDAISVLADKLYDPFTAAEARDTAGDLLVHYQVPLLDGPNVWMEFKTGRFIECNPPGSGIPPRGETACGQAAWNSQIWNEKRLHWEGPELIEMWSFQSDWKPEPVDLASWEPVFHAVISGPWIYVPGFGGSVFKLDKINGTNHGRISPFGPLDPNTFVAGPLTADSNGNIYYNAIQLGPVVDLPPPPSVPAGYPTLVGAWLVKIANNGRVSMVSYSSLLPLAPTGTQCERSFFTGALPWPGPNNFAAPRIGQCGGQRPGLNIAPAIAPDGTIYTASRGHFPAGDRQSYVLALNPNLTLKWATSLKNTLNDGCGVTVPTATVPMPANPPWDLATFKGKCRFGAALGVDPATNRRGSARILDSGTSSPTILPDGNILFGAYTRYNIARGHTYKLRASDGAIQATYDFGWDDTVAVVPAPTVDDPLAFSIVMKDNHYDEEAGYYCNTLTNASGNTIPTVSQGGLATIKANVVCDFTNIPAGPFYITQLDSNLLPQWKFQATETRSCHRAADGSVSCVDDGKHPNGFEWCINAPAVDGNGNVFVESEDGNIYVIDQGHTGVFTTPKFSLFGNLAIGAAYTPFAIDHHGRGYAQNNGHLFVVGEGGGSIRHSDEGNGPHTDRRHPTPRFEHEIDD